MLQVSMSGATNDQAKIFFSNSGNDYVLVTFGMTGQSSIWIGGVRQTAYIGTGSSGMWEVCIAESKVAFAYWPLTAPGPIAGAIVNYSPSGSAFGIGTGSVADYVDFTGVSAEMHSGQLDSCHPCHVLGCPQCIDELAPIYLQLSVQGITSSPTYCPDGGCEQINDQYILEGGFGGTCYWGYYFPAGTEICGYTCGPLPNITPCFIEVHYDEGWMVSFMLKGKCGATYYLQSPGEEFDCMNLNVKLPLVLPLPADQQCINWPETITLCSV